MNQRPFEPPNGSLSDEERELAERLARLGLPGGPSPELDAKILSAAHSAVAGSARKRRPRWPLYAGAAASVLFAVGIAWQLRPAPERPAMAASDAPVAEMVSAPPPETAAAPVESAPAGQSLPPPPPARSIVPPHPGSVAAAPPRKREAPAAPAPVVRPRAAPAPMADVATPTGGASAPSAEPAFVPEPRAAATPAPESGLMARKAAVNAERQRAEAMTAREMAAREEDAYAPPSPPAPVAASDSTSLDSVTVTGTQVGSLAGTAVAEDAKLSRRKWLKRIHQRIEQGDTDGARDSLRLFVGKYPQAELPPELRELLEE